jgi:serine/threonine-protein kinase
MSEGARELVGTVLGSYRVEKVLGEGAMGEVLLAVHEALARPVAIKILKPAVAADRSLTDRFFAEARAVNIIRHENIVECTDLVQEPNGRSYIVMELLEGKTLSAAIRAAGRIPARRTARIAAQIADAIGAAHAKGIVHRDLKPDNVFLIRRAGSNDYVKVLDFGIARLKPDLGGVGATQSGALIGTPAYMSPEQARGEKVGPGADVYALGVIVFHMLTGELPFAATSLPLMLVAHLQHTPPRADEIAPEVPRAMADLVARALSKEPSDRPADMAAFRRELLEAAGLPAEVGTSLVESSPKIEIGVALAATAPGSSPALSKAVLGSTLSAATGQVAQPTPKRSKLRWIAAGGGIAAAAVVAIVVMTASSTPSTPARRAAPAAQPTQPRDQPPIVEPPAAQLHEPAPTTAPVTVSPSGATASTGPAGAPPVTSPSGATASTGSAAAPIPTASTPAPSEQPAPPRPKRTVRRTDTKSPAAGSASTAPAKAEPQPPPTKTEPAPVKRDRSKMLVPPPAGQ